MVIKKVKHNEPKGIKISTIIFEGTKTRQIYTNQRHKQHILHTSKLKILITRTFIMINNGLKDDR